MQCRACGSHNIRRSETLNRWNALRFVVVFARCHACFNVQFTANRQAVRGSRVKKNSTSKNSLG